MAAQVGIVLVSHSAPLAEGAAELAAQVGGGAMIEPAGGTSDGRLGTSAEKVTAALRRASAGAGVLIIPDLGSAVLTVKTLLADLEDGSLEDASPDGEAPGGQSPGAGAFGSLGPVEVADAPFVEGAVAAAVTAAAGAPLAAVRAAAEEARHARKL
jgi:dihydroxyacetone kinase DhaKLM complex PTS-EIIA-like component DhaM